MLSLSKYFWFCVVSCFAGETVVLNIFPITLNTWEINKALQLLLKCEVYFKIMIFGFPSHFSQPKPVLLPEAQSSLSTPIWIFLSPACPGLPASVVALSAAEGSRSTEKLAVNQNYFQTGVVLILMTKLPQSASKKSIKNQWWGWWQVRNCLFGNSLKYNWHLWLWNHILGSTFQGFLPPRAILTGKLGGGKCNSTARACRRKLINKYNLHWRLHIRP